MDEKINSAHGALDLVKEGGNVAVLCHIAGTKQLRIKTICDLLQTLLVALALTSVWQVAKGQGKARERELLK